MAYSTLLLIASTSGGYYSAVYNSVYYCFQVIYPIITLYKLHVTNNYPNISKFFYAKLYSVLLGSIVTKWSLTNTKRVNTTVIVGMINCIELVIFGEWYEVLPGLYVQKMLIRSDKQFIK